MLSFLVLRGGGLLSHFRNEASRHASAQNVRKRLFSNPTLPKNLLAHGKMVEVVVRSVVVVNVVPVKPIGLVAGVVVEVVVVVFVVVEFAVFGSELVGTTAVVGICVCRLRKAGEADKVSTVECMACSASSSHSGVTCPSRGANADAMKLE